MILVTRINFWLIKFKCVIFSGLALSKTCVSRVTGADRAASALSGGGDGGKDSNGSGKLIL